MTRWLVPFALCASMTGCIIYETGESTTDCDGICATGSDTHEYGGTGAQTEPEAVMPLFTFTDGAALPGDALLTWIACDDPTFDYTQILTVTFVGEASPTQLVLREDEAMLVIEVDDEATPGQIEVILELADGSAVLLDGGFTILDPEAQGTGTTSGGGTSGGTTGGGTTGGGCNQGGGGDTGMGPC